jgi:hypothetical protein
VGWWGEVLGAVVLLMLRPMRSLFCSACVRCKVRATVPHHATAPASWKTRNWGFLRVQELMLSLGWCWGCCRCCPHRSCCCPLVPAMQGVCCCPLSCNSSCISGDPQMQVPSSTGADVIVGAVLGSLLSSSSFPLLAPCHRDVRCMLLSPIMQ